MPGAAPPCATEAAPARQPIVRIEGIVKRFGATTAVDGVSLAIERGAFFALLGPSGCGKTTLLRLLAGFERPDAGRILIDGMDVAAVPPYRRPTNMMFQSYALFPHMSVADNVAFGLKQEGLPRAEVWTRVKAMLDLVQLGAFAGRRPHQLSGGERQRVALARALAKEPKLLLLDEPLAALDRKLREETRLELVRIQHRVGITFLMVTHDQEEAMTMASRMAVMSAGGIVQEGSPAEIYEAPNSRFIADFIGAVNLIEGRVVATAGGALTIECPELAAALTASHSAVLARGTAVVLAVRPEKITLAGAPPADLANRVPGTVREVAYRGEASTYHVVLAGGRTLRVTLSNRRPGAQPGFGAGTRVWLGWEAGAGVVLVP